MSKKRGIESIPSIFGKLYRMENHMCLMTECIYSEAMIKEVEIHFVKKIMLAGVHQSMIWETGDMKV